MSETITTNATKHKEHGPGAKVLSVLLALLQM